METRQAVSTVLYYTSLNTLSIPEYDLQIGSYKDCKQSDI